ncbi:hypothetical protein B5E84_19405 [Lachnoclostridium sp. An14]|uniref:DUF6673 family protein n=1 Tax=Lachnoclostridium sp. An14 TaxID=1965562 RepID=UPI000B3A4CC4|nr:DUF6673 family protein [Lachnoclostridium sp. An14]OUQ12095.1 hypothetical protein B5E84_19405 [Lachnoclostridium sp. An14]
MSLKWEYNGVILEVDLQDADFAERYEKAFARMEESEKELQKVGVNSEMIRGYCNLFYQLFDDIYGDGTGEKLFAGKKNARMCDEAYRNFLAAAKKDADDARNQRMSFISRFTPHQNRQQRRHRGQNKGKQIRRNEMS